LTYCGTHALIQPQLKIHFEIFSLLLIDEPPAIILIWNTSAVAG